MSRLLEVYSKGLYDSLNKENVTDVICLLNTSDAADDEGSVGVGGRRRI